MKDSSASLVFSDVSGGKCVGYNTYAAPGSGLMDQSLLNVVIPSMFGGSNVIEIGYQSFSSTKIKSVFIPHTVEVIDYLAFWRCSDLKTVTFGENSRLRKIGIGAFMHCPSIESIDIPPSVSDMATSSEDRSFYNNKAMVCLSYLGTLFKGNMISKPNASLVVHTLPEYSGSFDTIKMIKDGKLCNPNFKSKRGTINYANESKHFLEFILLIITSQSIVLSI